MTDLAVSGRDTRRDSEAQHRSASRTSAGEGPAYWFFDALAVVRTPETVLPIVIEMTVPPGGGAPLHVHADLDDSFYLASGQVAVRCGEERFAAEAGSYVVLPHGVPHTFRVVGSENAVMVQIHADDSFLRFIKSAGRAATTRDLPVDAAPHDLDALFKIAAETGQPVIGPPMTSEEAEEIVSATRD